MKQQMQVVNNADNKPFLSNEQTVAHQSDKFVLDFRSVYPQFVQAQGMIILNHQVILLDSYNAKMLLNVLKESIDRYEKKFGEIKKPETLIKAEKDLKKEAITTTERPTYMG